MAFSASEAPIFDGCVEHKVSTKAVNERWTQVNALDPPRALLAMCRCCYGPALVDYFDALGIGWGEMLCSRCAP